MFMHALQYLDRKTARMSSARQRAEQRIPPVLQATTAHLQQHCHVGVGPGLAAQADCLVSDPRGQSASICAAATASCRRTERTMVQTCTADVRSVWSEVVKLRAGAGCHHVTAHGGSIPVVMAQRLTCDSEGRPAQPNLQCMACITHGDSHHLVGLGRDLCDHQPVRARGSS